MKKDLMMLVVALMLSIVCKANDMAVSATLDERATLVKIFEALNGQNWSERDRKGWCTDAPMSEWAGVSVNSEGKVVRLKLPLSNVKGVLPDEIQNLSSLTYLEIRFFNMRTGFKNPVPACVFQMSSLENLKLSVYTSNADEYIQLPATFNLPNLKYLVLSEVKGDLHQLGSCTNLEQITLKNCTPDIPAEIADCAKLNLLYWEGEGAPNQPLTPELAKLSKLSRLEIYTKTPYDEKLPDFIWNMGSLKVLVLKNVASNHGELDAKKVAQLPSIENLRLIKDGITNLPEGLFAIPTLKYLTLSDNAISGKIPASIGNSNLQSLDLDSNAGLTGKIPDSMGNLKDLYSLSLKKTGVDQKIPKSVEELPRFKSFGERIF